MERLCSKVLCYFCSSVFVITMDRYIAVVYPIIYKIKLTKSKIYISIFLGWFVGIAFNVPIVLPSSDIIDGNCLVLAVWQSDVSQGTVGIVVFVVKYFAPLVIMAVCYSRMIHVLRTVSTFHGFGVEELNSWHIRTIRVGMRFTHRRRWTRSSDDRGWQQ